MINNVAILTQKKFKMMVSKKDTKTKWLQVKRVFMVSQQTIDLFHIVISLSLAARYLARFRVTSQAWGKL